MITACLCNDCDTLLMARGFMSGFDRDWCMLRDRVWRAAIRGSPYKRFLCIACTERRLDRRLTAKDFRRNARVNFVGRKSRRLKLRMRGLEPAKHLPDLIQ